MDAQKFDTHKLGILFRHLRKDQKLSQKTLAERSGIGIKTIRAIEKGQQKKVSLENFHQISKALGYRPEDVLKKYYLDFI